MRPNKTNSNSKKVFMENEKVIAVWAYNHKYPATVRQVLPNGLSQEQEGVRKRWKEEEIVAEEEEAEEEERVVEEEERAEEVEGEEDEYEYEFEKVFICEDLEIDEKSDDEILDKIKLEPPEFVDVSSFDVGSVVSKIPKEPVSKITEEIICKEIFTPIDSHKHQQTNRLGPKKIKDLRDQSSFRSKTNKPKKTIEEKRKYEREKKQMQRARKKEELIAQLNRKELRKLHGFPADYCYQCYQKANRPKIIRNTRINKKSLTVEEVRAYERERKREWRSKKRLQEMAEKEEDNPFKNEPCYCKKKKTKRGRGRPKKKTKRFLKTPKNSCDYLVSQ